MNAVLWSRTDEQAQKITLLGWFKDNNIDLTNYFDNEEDINLEDLRQLYVYMETHI